MPPENKSLMLLETQNPMKIGQDVPDRKGGSGTLSVKRFL
jgi:hypothetical protein